MATISAAKETSIMKIRAFLGLNENPDGDTTLKNGEMSEMLNFRITQDRHLQIRPGSKTILDLSDEFDTEGADTTVYGFWVGFIAGVEHVIVACGGKLFDIDIEDEEVTQIGTAAAAETTFFGFGGKVYLLNGTDYKSWAGTAGTSFADVVPYIPLIKTATTPAGDGTDLENVNRLTGKKRVQFSPDGTAATFQLPEKDITSVDIVTLNGVTKTVTTDYTVDIVNGTVTMTAVPAESVNGLEVQYTKGTGSPADVKSMKYSELYNGVNDTRVFLYGNGTNKTIYSGIRTDTGVPSADYFPDLYELKVGDDNTPITGLVRHFSKLLIYKLNSTWSAYYGTITLEDGSTTASFYVNPVNRQFGNDAPGQVKLLENNPLTIDAGSVYQWRSTSNNNGNVTFNENNAKRISDRVSSSLSSVNSADIRTFNIKKDHEFWFMYDYSALILNYSNDTWYKYDDLTFTRIFEYEQESYGLSEDGKLVHISRNYFNDNGSAIECVAKTGAMDFTKSWMLKYSPMIFVSMQPETNAKIEVTVESNRRSDYPVGIVSYGLANFNHVNFSRFSFGTNRRPQVSRLKIKVKKATFYTLVYKSNSANSTATIIETDVKLRYAGEVR